MELAALREWAACTPNTPGLIRLVLLDVDGCLTDGETTPLDIPAIQLIAGLNDRARGEADLPAITLCTGRPAPYVDAICQAIRAYVPAVWETGAGLYDPVSFQFHAHPELTVDRVEELQAIRRRVLEQIERPGIGHRQVGKELSITLYPSPDATLDQLHDTLVPIVSDLARSYTVHRLRTCVEILPDGITKGSGARWLSELLDMPLERMAGIGDQTADLSYLSIVGFAAVPANATLDLPARVHYASAAPSSRGVIDILNQIVARNRGVPATLTS
jgi:hypothetical protein